MKCSERNRRWKLVDCSEMYERKLYKGRKKIIIMNRKKNVKNKIAKDENMYYKN